MKQINELASNKAFANIEVLNRKLDKYVEELKTNSSILNDEQIEICISSTARELKVWNYIAKLIETNG